MSTFFILPTESHPYLARCIPQYVRCDWSQCVPRWNPLHQLCQWRK